MFKCEICGLEISNKGIGSHLKRKHNIENKEYYDKYIKTETEGICAKCGKSTSFCSIIRGYLKYCSNTCAQSSDEVKEHIKQTNIKNHGGVGTASPEIAKKIANTKEKRYGNSKFTNRQKCNETIQKRYGVTNFGQTPEAIIKKKQTYLNNYNVSNPLESKEIREKIKQTNIKKYGTENPAQNKDVNRKMFDTLWANGGYHRAEKRCYEKLLEKYPNAKYNYNKDSRYPYHCDFYIPEKDLFIELNAYWSHGGHWFDSTNQEDLDKVEYWKSKNNSFYDYAIKTWTESDIAKRECAIKNKLNYLVCWSEEEFMSIFDRDFSEHDELPDKIKNVTQIAKLVN